MAAAMTVSSFFIGSPFVGSKAQKLKDEHRTSNAQVSEDSDIEHRMKAERRIPNGRPG